MFCRPLFVFLARSAPTASISELLQDPVAQELLTSTNLAHLAYTWSDGTPRVIPIWFHWDGNEIVFGTPVRAPKNRIIGDNCPVAVTIDTGQMPNHLLSIRGTAHVTTTEGVVPEYALAAERYFGPEQGKAWAENIGKMFPQMVRIAVKPESGHILDFEKRFPTTIAEAMAAAQV